MAEKETWSDRSGTQKRRTFARFGIIYGVIAVVALVVGWYPIAAIFGLFAVGIGIGWATTEATEKPAPVAREKPDWMKAMDDPDAPDLTLPEYRTAQTPNPISPESPPPTDA